MAITQECCEQYWTSPGGNTQQGTNYTATCLPSRKLSKLDEPEKQGQAHKWCTPMDPHIWPSKSRMTSANIYTAAVRIQDVALKTCLRRWTIGRSGEKGSGISMLAARHDDDDIVANYDWNGQCWLSSWIHQILDFFIFSTYLRIIRFNLLFDFHRC